MSDSMKEHWNCNSYEPCVAGDPASCPDEINRQVLREIEGQWWKPLITQVDPGGLRHYLDGEKVQCGEVIEIQDVESVAFPDDSGNEYQRPLQTGRRVRYEASFGKDRINATLYTTLGGHEFVCRVEPWMRFRWPKR